MACSMHLIGDDGNRAPGQAGKSEPGWCEPVPRPPVVILPEPLPQPVRDLPGPQ